ncbi:MAG: hypothetical protein AB7G10_19915 [Reyranellaceae bacterium]
MNRSNLTHDPAPAADAGALLLAHAAVALRGAILHYAAGRPGPYSIADLAAKLCAAPEFLAAVAAGLEAEGHLVREPAGWFLTELQA